MRVGINLLYLIPSQVGGVERYAAGLLEGLAKLDYVNEYIVFVNQEGTDWPIPDLPNFKRIVCPVRAVSRLRRYFFEQFKLPALLELYNIELVHSLCYVSPLRVSLPSVVTIHDLNHKAFGQLMPITKRLALSFFVRQSALRATQVITDSEFSYQEILNAYQIPPQKLQVLYPGLPNKTIINKETANLWTDLKIVPPYIIAFSSPTPNKNIDRLIQAFLLAQKKYKLPHQLVLVGHLPEPLLHNESALGSIRATGYLEDAVLDQVLAQAHCLVFPSIYEGFGLPVLEAMNAGVPVISSFAGSLPEVAGDAALYFDPYDVEEIAAKIAEVAMDKALQQELRLRGKRNATRFSWEKMARETVAVYKQATSQFTPNI